MTAALATTAPIGAHLPLPLLLSPPDPFDESPLDALERERSEGAVRYDPARQTGGFDITMTSTKSAGICCVYSFGIDISSRDQVSDD